MTDFLLAGRMANTETQWKRMFLLLASLGINLGLLCYFKYTNFFYQMLAPLWNGKFQPLDIFLPVGISFFTFQSLSYTIDVYRRELVPLNRLLDYTFYVSFFPQLVAGPIVRARDFIPQIRQPLFVSSEMFGTGVFFIISGLFKKAVISDYISVNFVERILIIRLFIPGLRICLVYMGMLYRFIVTFPDIVIWLSGLLCCWASVFL